MFKVLQLAIFFMMLSSKFTFSLIAIAALLVSGSGLMIKKMHQK